MSYEPVDGLGARLDGPVLRLTIDRARTRNSFDDVMVEAFIRYLEAAGQDEDVRVVALTSATPDFCAGADIVARNKPTGARPRVGSIQRRTPVLAHRLVPLMTTVQTPIVSAVRGWASGLGFHLALASDFCVAAENARFWEPFVARGFTPDSGATWLLPRLIGAVRTRELLILGRELSGREAAAWGLVHRAVPDADLDATAEELVQQLAVAPTVAVGLTKWLIQRGAELDFDGHLANEALALELSSRTSDFKEGFAAFREKRTAHFEGR